VLPLSLRGFFGKIAGDARNCGAWRLLAKRKRSFISLLISLSSIQVAILVDIDSMALTPAPEDQESKDGPRFLIEEQLGEGGFGKVYLGEDTRLDRKVAIKVLNREISQVADSAGAAFDEARALAGIEHRHVVPVYDAGRTLKGEVFVVSKFIEGCTLEEALVQGDLSREEFLERMIEVSDALEAVHEAGIIHRDIKPDNILLDAERKAVLIDFGIAATVDGAGWLRQAGTPKYMSPEQARGQDHHRGWPVGSLQSGSGALSGSGGRYLEVGDER
jgi:serine/threonine protein kinase